MSKKSLSQNQVIIIGVSLVAIILAVIIFPVNSVFINTPLPKVNSVNISPNIQNGPISQGSVVNTAVVYVTPPNQTLVQSALNKQSSVTTAIQNTFDSVGCKDNSGLCGASSQKFLINTQIVLFDSNQRQYQSSIFTNIPTQSFLPWNPKITVNDYKNQVSYQIPQIPRLALVDSSNPSRLLDLGSVQLGLYGVTTTDTNVVASGQFAVYLDDILRYTGNVASQGNTTNKIIPLQIGNRPAFTFTFSDEGKTWTNGTTHYFKVYVGNVTASVGTGTSTQTFQYTKNALVYVLAMTLNSDKKVMLGVDNKAIAVFKNDDIIEACSRNAVIGSQALGGIGSSSAGTYSVFVQKPATSTGLITISQNGFSVTSIISNGATPNFNSGNPDSVDSSVIQGGKSCVAKTGLPRDTDLNFNINGINVLYHTPMTQTTLIYDCSGDLVANDPQNPNTRTAGLCPSNFISK